MFDFERNFTLHPLRCIKEEINEKMSHRHSQSDHKHSKDHRKHHKHKKHKHRYSEEESDKYGKKSKDRKHHEGEDNHASKHSSRSFPEHSSRNSRPSSYDESPSLGIRDDPYANHNKAKHIDYNEEHYDHMGNPIMTRPKDTDDKYVNSNRLKIDSDTTKSESNEIDVDFMWAHHRQDLNQIFFRNEKFIRRGSSRYHDLWSFVTKYQTVQRKKVHGGQKPKFPPNDPDIDEKKLDIKISEVKLDLEYYIKNAKDDPKGKMKGELTKQRLREFWRIILLFFDFEQKQEASRISKIKKDKENLPIFQYRQKIIDAVKETQLILVAGDTGCGKSTQVPQYLMEAGYEKVACTQPRRIACISLAKRVGYETLNAYGDKVGYQVRFEKSKTAATRILFLTEGLLLRQLQTDATLDAYKVIIIDEVHERHIHTDYLLGVIRALLLQRDDLKVVLMSATINISLFSNYFDDAPVIKVPGRLFPIQLEYHPVTAEDTSETSRLDPSPYLRIMQAIEKKYPVTERGDLLIFLSGMSDIKAVSEAARELATKTKHWIVLQLHSALSIQEQDRVFDIAPEGVRKCIVSTNIAETSVTIDGVRFIVDSGKVKEMSYDAKYKMQKLKEFWISRASAEQRKGRAGRTGPGVCYRLYSEADYNELQAYSTPEIQRVPLEGLILQMANMGLPDARKFPFIEKPDISNIETSIIVLQEQGALTEEEVLTPIGKMLAQLPVDVVIGKMLIMGSIFHMMDPVLSVAAALSVQSPLTSNSYYDYDCKNNMKNIESDHGDPFTLLSAFDEWIQVKAEGRGTKKWCKRRGLEEQRFYEMTKLKQQFKELLRDHNLLPSKNQDVDTATRYLTADERKKQHAQRKQLGQLKREQKQSQRKRKVLKLNDDDFHIISDEEDDGTNPDLRDLEFRLTNNIDAMQETSNESRNFTLREINMLKIILCSGLYPQVAIADEHNTSKIDSEQMFHTKHKSFLYLQPNAVLAHHPEVLQLSDKDIVADTNNASSVGSQHPMSNKHQLLAYVTLLETTKPYLVNTMRVPALQTLLLYASAIDTNTDCTRIVVDSWLELKFQETDEAEKIIASVIQLRHTWQQLLQARLEDKFGAPHSSDGEHKATQKSRKLEKLLASKLAEYLESDVVYSIRRVLTAETNHLYVGPNYEEEPVLKEIFKASSTEPNTVKGGVRVNDYLTYNCLQADSTASVWGEYTSHMQKHWTCPHCNEPMIVTVLDRLQHEATCQANKEKQQELISSKGSSTDVGSTSQSGMSNPLKKEYHCPLCSKDFNFTNTEILKHRKTCRNDN
ncbi:unnamed protein product [Owenia fusiformis]|uniref:Uncharacterized protein n=1 Tax=Owenia fusiformis TaxID=6347 RepID=A0A8J1TW12_OWEFU|nr:unnamed protein product [Owenia fusiformis]